MNSQNQFKRGLVKFSSGLVTESHDLEHGGQFMKDIK